MGVKRKSMVCLSEEGAIIMEPPSHEKEELVWWERRGREKSASGHTQRLGT